MVRKCMYCEHTFKQNKTRRRHVHRVHNRAGAFCPHCNEPFLADAHCQQHIQAVHAGQSMPIVHKLATFSAQATKMSPASNKLYDQPGNQLDTFIADVIQPTARYLSACNSAVDQLVHVLQNNTPDSLRPRRVIKGGSLGKGTAVLNKSDVDLVVMLRDYTDVRELVKDLPKISNELEKYLSMQPNIKVTGKTPFAVKIDIQNGMGQTNSADVLPAVDVIGLKTKNEVFQEMASRTDLRRYYSASLSVLQMNLYASLPTKLKSLIRLIKYWKKDKFLSTGFNLPTSYVLELVIINAWCRAGRPYSFDMKRAAHAVLTSLTRHKSFRVIFPGDLGGSTAFDQIPGPGNPFIIDPCNPFNNVYSTPVPWDWDALSREATRWLGQETFRGVGGDTSTDW